MTILARRQLLTLAAVGGGLVGLDGALSRAFAADTSELAKARAEGEAVFYANITSVQSVMKAFDKATGVKGLYTRSSSTQFIPTVLTESQAGKLLADVLQAPRPMIEFLEKHGVLAAYRSPSAKGYPAWATKSAEVTEFGIEYVSYLYNTNLVKPADVPATYADLADPKWKNQIVMANPSNHTSTIAWLVALKEQVFKSDSDWMAYLKGVAANAPMFVASFGPTPAPIASGQKAIAISMPKYIVTHAPAPLGWAPKAGPLFGTSRAIAIAKHAPHPAAARVFMDYWLSKPAMELLAKNVGEYVLAPGVFPDVPGIDKVEVKPVRDLSDAEFKKWGREFGRIFSVH